MSIFAMYAEINGRADKMAHLNRAKRVGKMGHFTHSERLSQKSSLKINSLI